ncbi:MAG: histidine kinase [Thermonemataceae bacterium]|nr:histidine kinase [Thermonemataceae bacterium]
MRILVLLALVFNIQPVLAQSLLASTILKKGRVELPNSAITTSKTQILTQIDGFVSFYQYKQALSFRIHNDLPYAYEIYLYIGSQDIYKHSSIDFVRSSKGMNGVVAAFTNHKFFYNGYLVPIRFQQHPENLQVLSLVIAPNTTESIHLFFWDLPSKKSDTKVVALAAESYLPLLIKQQEQKNTSEIISYSFVGAILLMFAFALAIYSQNRMTDFLWYAMYLLTMLLFGLIDIFPLNFKNFFFWQYPSKWIYAKEATVYFYLIFYHSFLMSFLQLKTTKRGFYNSFYIVNTIYFILFLCNMMVLIFSKNIIIHHQILWLNSWVFYSSILFYIYFFVRLWKLRNVPFSRYIFWGSFIFYSGNVAAIYLNQAAHFDKPFYPNNFIQIGAMIEILFFALALGRKTLQDSEEKKKLISEMNERLQEQVSEKTQEITQKSEELRQEQTQKMLLAFEKQVQEMKLYSLQTQLNPHFLFNCLNTIKSLVVQQKNKEASAYLKEFAFLMRATLENSQKLEISLKDSIAYLKSYIEIEKLRFDGDFDYEINQDIEEDEELLQIHPMLIQPFVENALLHGLAPLQKNKQLVINFIEKEDILICEIIDNGRGFDYEHSMKNKTSKGLQIIRNYFEIWNKKTQQNAIFEIISEKNKGTKVKISIYSN